MSGFSVQKYVKNKQKTNKKRSSPNNQWVFGLNEGIHHKSVGLWFHPKMVTPGVGHSPPPSDATGSEKFIKVMDAKNIKTNSWRN